MDKTYSTFLDDINPKKIGYFKAIFVPIVWIFVFFNLFTVAWMALSSLKTPIEIFNVPWAIPDILQWHNYVSAWQDGGFQGAVVNTVLVTAGCAVFTILIAAPAAYVLSRFTMKSASPLTLYFAMGIGIPAQLIVLPLYVVMNQMGLVNSLWGLWLLYVATSLPFAVFFLTGFFATLDSEMEEAATLDGASPFYTFWYIMLPLARSGIITLFILNLIGHWNETLFAIIFLQTDDKITLSIALINFMQQMQYGDANWGGLFAGVSIIVLPMLLVYIWAGRRIIEGMTLGSGK